MDHVVYVDKKANEMDNILNNSKTIIIRGAAGRKTPYGKVEKNDVLYLMNNNGEGLVKSKCIVKSVMNSDKLSKNESINLVKNNMDNLKLSDKQYNRFAGKKYIIFIEIDNPEEVEPFKIDKSNYSNMDDWLIVEDIKSVKL